MTAKKSPVNSIRIRKLLMLFTAAVLVMLLCGCRARLTDNENAGMVIADEDGYRSETYEMKREELGLYETKESVFGRFFIGSSDEEDDAVFDEGFESGMDDYYNSEDEEEDDAADSSDSVSNSPSGTVPPRTGVRPSTRPGMRRPSTVRPSRPGNSSKPSTTPTKPGNSTDPGTTPSNPSTPTDDNPSSKEFTVTLDPNGGSVSTTSLTVKEGGTYGSLPAPEYDGHTFEGWFTDKDGGSKVTSSSKPATAGDHTLYAHWKEMPTASYTISFDPNGGSLNGESSKTLNKGDSYGSLPSASYDGYDFLGWFTSAEGGDQVSEGDTFNGDSDTTLYAHWEYNAFKYWDAQLDAVSVSDKSKAILVTSDDKITSKGSLLSKAGLNNIWDGGDKDIMDEDFSLDKDPDLIVKVANNMDNASDERDKLRNRLGWNGTIVIVPKAAVGNNDLEKLFYTISLSGKIYGTFDDNEIKRAANELGAGRDIIVY